jgi:N-acyl-D-amino-acid deacylase
MRILYQATGRLVVLLLLNPAAAFPADEFDIAFVNGTVVDGTGQKRYQADVGVSGAMITAIGDLRGEPAKRTVDITGMIIAPGFIDMHTHNDAALLGTDPFLKTYLNGVYQGVTTVVIGQDGRHSKKFDEAKPGQISRQMEYIGSNGAGSNVGFLMGHDNIRMMVMGDDYKRFSTPAEMKKMAEYVDQYMKEGAFGLSLGLEYASGKYSDVEELVYLAKAMAKHSKNAIIVAHERASGPQHRYYLPSQHNLHGDRQNKYPNGHDVIDYCKEGIEIAEKSGIVFDFSHIKITGRSYWGKSKEFIRLVDDARARGVRVYAEHKPLIVSGNSPMDLTLVPSWATGSGAGNKWNRLSAVMKTAKGREDVRKDIAYEIDKQGGWENLVVVSAKNSSWVGKTIQQLGRDWGIDDDVDTVLKMQEDGDQGRPNGCQLRTQRTLSDTDLNNFVKTDWCAFATDGSPKVIDDSLTDPRRFIAFTRGIAHFVRDEKVITLEHGVRAGSGLPAEMLSLTKRGLLKEGYQADIHVFDLDKLEPRSKWVLKGSRKYSKGVFYVMVNGVLVLDNEKPTGKLPGAIIDATQAWSGN